MASSQTFSIKLTANGKEVTDLMDALKEKANDYEKQLDKINEQLKERDKLTKEEIKALEKESDSQTDWDSRPRSTSLGPLETSLALRQ